MKVLLTCDEITRPDSPRDQERLRQPNQKNLHRADSGGVFTAHDATDCLAVASLAEWTDEGVEGRHCLDLGTLARGPFYVITEASVEVMAVRFPDRLPLKQRITTPLLRSWSCYEKP